VLLSATPYDGLLGVIPQGGAMSLAPNLVQCLRSQLGTRLADVAAARWTWEDGSEDTVVVVVGHRQLEVLTLDATGVPHLEREMHGYHVSPSHNRAWSNPSGTVAWGGDPKNGEMVMRGACADRR
jgi:hypothetical protein